MSPGSSTRARPAARRKQRWEARFVAVFAALAALVGVGAVIWNWHSIQVWGMERRSISDLQQAAAAQEQPDPWTNLVLGRKLADADRRREAVEAFGDGLRQLQLKDNPPLRAQFDGELALNLALLGEDETAQPYMRKALDLDASNVSAAMALGWILRHRGRNDLATEQFGLVTRIEPRYAPAWYEQGQLLLDSGKRSEAEVALRKAVALDPRRAKYQLGLGNCLATESRMDDAVAAFKEAVRLAPSSREAATALARARTLKAKTPEEYRTARAELEPLVKDSTDAAFIGHLGVLDSQFNQLESAERYLKRAIELDPANPETSYALAVVYRRQGHEAEARQTLAKFRRMEQLYRRVVELQKRLPSHPYDLAMNLELAQKLEERTQYAEAIRQYRYVVRVFPNQKDAQQRLAALERKYGALDRTTASEHDLR